MFQTNIIISILKSACFDGSGDGSGDGSLLCET